MFKTTVKITGMMCPHCEARVDEMFTTQLGASKSRSSHKKGETVVYSEQPLDEQAVKDAVQALGFTAESMASETARKWL